MCILLTRYFRCWQAPEREEDPTEKGLADGEPAPKRRGQHPKAGHRSRHVVRCANPFPRTCLVSPALFEVDQHFKYPCPDCSCTYIEPAGRPAEVECFYPNEDKGGDNNRGNAVTRWLDAAADAYTTKLCEYLLAMFSKGNVTYNFADLVERWRVCNVESACVFDPQHFDTARVCDCQESNTAPELRNMSHAIRCRSARRAIADDEDLLETGNAVTRWLDAAADAYTTKLCEYLLAMFSKGNVTYNFADLVERWRVCNVESACVFDPQHFDTARVCDCQESNTAPELRNMSHAIRCRSARRAIADDEDLLETYAQVAPHPIAALTRRALKRDYLDKHPPIQAAFPFNGIPVLPIADWICDEHTCTPEELFARIGDAVQSFETEDNWETIHKGEGGSRTCGLAQRIEILSTVAVLLSEDNGLARRQIHKIFLNSMNLLRPMDIFFTGPSVIESYGPAMLALLQLGTFFDGHQRAGNALIDPDRFQNLVLALKQKRSLRFTDELMFDEAIKGTIAEAVSKQELDADNSIVCLLCKDKLVALDRTFLDQKAAEHSENYREGHIAIRVKCQGRHVFCIKCWLGFWKSQTANGQPKVQCHECDEELPLKRLEPAVPIVDADYFDPANTLGSGEPRLNWASLAAVPRHPQDWGVWDPLLGANYEPLAASPPQGLSDSQVTNTTRDGSPLPSRKSRLRAVDEMNWVGRGTWLDDGSFRTMAQRVAIGGRPFEQQLGSISTFVGDNSAARRGTAGRAGWTAAAMTATQSAQANAGIQVHTIDTHHRKMNPTSKVTESARASLGASPQSQPPQSEDYDDSVSRSDDSRNGSVDGTSLHTQGSEASFSGKAVLPKGSYDFHKKWTVTNEQLFGTSEALTKKPSASRTSLSSFIVSDSEEADGEDFDYSSIVQRLATRGVFSTYVSDFMSPGNDVTAPEDGMNRVPRASHSTPSNPSTASSPTVVDLSSEHSDPGDSEYGSYPCSTHLEGCDCGGPPLRSSDDDVEQDVARSPRRPARPWWRRAWAVFFVLCAILFVPAPGAEYWKIHR
ncbi:hypothetical protein BN1708_011699 [Verticillium longisporum]|uniref:Uncharacterized protein n=1 Tax=Verticillium longisporum TaxID=100787 RepID=A0A0G4L2Q4_VERLO|nr:hypothetical protein BN1708_011699 [Verticillium longisporum]